MVEGKQKQIHVVHIIPRLGFGGAERFVVQLTKHISEKTIKQSVITLWDDRPLMSHLPPGVSCTVFPLDKIGYLSRVRKLRQVLRDMEADVVHTHLFSADLWGRRAARSLGIPVVTTEHNINIQESWLWEMIKRRMRNFSTLYTAPSIAVKKFMKTAYRIPENKVRVIMHGIDVNNFKKIKKAHFTSPYQLVMVGRLTQQKGHAIALEALAELRDISWTLMIVGVGEEKENLVHLSEKLGIAEKIIWNGVTTDVASVYAHSDMVLVPSRWEGLGMVVLEAFASERLVIASRVDGIPEMITSGTNGILVAKENPEELAQAIRSCIENKNESLAIAKRGREWALDHADVHDMASAYEAVYRELVTD